MLSCKINANKYSECAFVALSIQHSKRMRRMILSSVVSPALPCVSTLSRKLHDFLEKVVELKCGFWFPLQLLSETRLIPWRIQRGVIANVPTTSCTVPTHYTSQKLVKSEFSRQMFPRILRHELLWKSVPWEPSCSCGPSSSRETRQTWRSQ